MEHTGLCLFKTKLSFIIKEFEYKIKVKKIMNLNFREVYSARDRVTGEIVAMKKLLFHSRTNEGVRMKIKQNSLNSL